MERDVKETPVLVASRVAVSDDAQKMADTTAKLKPTLICLKDPFLLQAVGNLLSGTQKSGIKWL